MSDPTEFSADSPDTTHSADRLDQALAELAPGAASPGFTGRVMAALDEAGGRSPAWRGGDARRWALAAAAALAVAIGIYLGARPEPPLAALAAERESLRLEHDELMRELESLRSLAMETRPVLYLGTGDDVDYVLDLSPLVEQTTATARPAGFDEAALERPRYY